MITRADFTPGAAIGTGAYGTVYRVQYKDIELEKRADPSNKKARMYALKEMLIQRFVAEGRIKEVFIERCVLSHLNHPTVIKFY